MLREPNRSLACLSAYVENVLIGLAVSFYYLGMFNKVYAMKNNMNLTRYLGIDILQQSDILPILAERHISESITKIEGKVRTIKKDKSPMESELYVEVNNSSMLGSKEHK